MSIGVAIDDPMSEMSKKILDLEEEITAYKAKIMLVKEQRNLSAILRLERFKNKLYRHLIEQNTRIRVDDVLVEEDDGIHVYNIKGGSIPVFVHENIKGDEGLTVTHQILPTHHRTSIKKIVSVKKVKTKSTVKKVKIKAPPQRGKSSSKKEDVKHKKQSYRSIKTCLDLVPEISNEVRAVNIDLVDVDIKEQLKKFGSLDEAKESFYQLIKKLKNSRIYTKILNDLKQRRWSVFGRMPVSDYQNLVVDHIRVIEDIFREKKYTVQKMRGIISKGLTSLEGRLVAYGDYTIAHLEVDEIQKLSTVLDVGAQSPKEYVPYDSSNICNSFYNYGIVLFPLMKCVDRYLFNRYGFLNVIYAPLPKNLAEDPYSFYELERVNKGRRYWKMDCRMEDLSTALIANVLPYMVSMFRKLYQDVFDDNEFRVNYTGKCQLTECDCEQLLQNIILIGQPKKFCNMIRKRVVKKASMMPTENDKFNLYGDDALQRSRFQNKEDIDLVDIIKQLFDGITSVEAVDFYRSRTI